MKFIQSIVAGVALVAVLFASVATPAHAEPMITLAALDRRIDDVAHEYDHVRERGLLRPEAIKDVAGSLNSIMCARNEALKLTNAMGEQLARHRTMRVKYEKVVRDHNQNCKLLSRQKARQSRAVIQEGKARLADDLARLNRIATNRDKLITGLMASAAEIDDWLGEVIERDKAAK